MHRYSLFRWTLCCLLTLLLTSTLPARTPPGVDSGSSKSHSLRNDQYDAVISCENGQETLDLRMDLIEQPGAGWVIAIPAPRQDISLSWLNEIPTFNGRPPIWTTRSRLHSLFAWSRATQIYPILYEIFFVSHGVSWSAEIPPAVPFPTHAGLTCGLYAPASRVDLERALNESELEFLPDELNRLMRYLDGKHTFAIIRLVSVADYRDFMGTKDPDKHVPGLEIRFPSDLPVLPFHAVAKYSSERCLHDVRIFGYVNLPPELANREDVQGYFQIYRSRGTFNDPRAPALQRDIAYTHWQYWHFPFEVPFVPVPAGTFAKVDGHFAEFSSDRTLVSLFFLITGLCSYLSAGIAGLVVERRLRAFKGVGLWNFGTIIALRFRLASKYWTATGLTPAKRDFFLVVFTVTYLLLNYLAASYLFNYIAS